MQLASDYLPQKGYVLDYTALISTNNFTFQGDSTYYVSGGVTLSGTAIIEGGSVIKFTNLLAHPAITVGTVKCATGQYRPAVFTSKDDDTVGETIAGSTGNPTNYYTLGYGTMLATTYGATLTLNDCRFSFAYIGISTSGNLTLTNVQFVNCATPIYGANDGITVTVRNGLFWSNTNSIVFRHGHERVFIGEHITVNEGGTFIDNSGTYDCSISDSRGWERISGRQQSLPEQRNHKHRPWPGG
jgi:hypothetical protein